MDHLKLVALDDQDLAILSAHVQDAVTKAGDLKHMPAQRRFVVPMNRFVWEGRTGLAPKTPERRNAVLHFDRVTAARSTGLSSANKAEALSLLALTFAPSDAPSGVVELLFAGGATIRLEVECIEARLADLGGAWEASSTPRHAV